VAAAIAEAVTAATIAIAVRPLKVTRCMCLTPSRIACSERPRSRKRAGHARPSRR
jgi:hypothetical protein